MIKYHIIPIELNSSNRADITILNIDSSEISQDLRPIGGSIITSDLELIFTSENSANYDNLGVIITSDINL